MDTFISFVIFICPLKSNFAPDEIYSYKFGSLLSILGKSAKSLFYCDMVAALLGKPKGQQNNQYK